ncbi:MAG: permease-like cell division protein FtsX [Candidatus Saccharimonadales bacterium]
MLKTLLRKLLMLWRVITSGTRNFFRNAWLSVAATTVMVITLTIILGAVVLNMALGDTLDKITESIDIAIFFNDDAPMSMVNQLQNDLEELDNVTGTEYISKDDALRQYRLDNIDNQDVLDAVTEGDNPLPTSLEVQVQDLQLIDEIIMLTQEDQYLTIIEDTSLGEDRRRTIERIADTRQFLITAGIAASLIFASVSVLIIFNTIRMAIFARGDEISIMRLVGATNGFIRGPFLFEAILDGLIAASISLGLVYLLLFRGATRIVNDFISFDATIAFFSDQWLLVVLATLAAGALIGVISSMMAMVRYLKL